MRPCRLLCLSLCLLTACGPVDSVITAKVTGKVTADGKPLERGLIQFIPTDGRGSPAAAEIHQGDYTVAVPLGSKRVEVTSPKVIGKQKAYDTPDSPVMDIIEEQIPWEYNAQSQLKADVSRERTKFDFAVKFKPAP